MSNNNNDNEIDWVGGASVFVIFAFAAYGLKSVVESFVGAARGESSPLEAIAFLVMLLGFCVGNLVIVGLGCLLLTAGVFHTSSMRGGA